MGPGTMTRPASATITLHEFQEALGRYGQVIEQLSASKTVKPGQKTLAELDRHRYAEAPTLFSLEKSSRTMQLEDVKTLVEWKLKHGKFRPTLMKLVSSNDEKFVEDTVKSAVSTYRQVADPSAAVDVLTKLRGIGPATASLLLAVLDPENVIFFADEAFYWLCRGGRREPIKYNAREYRELITESQSLARRLGVKAIDVERVAYVLMSDSDSSSSEKEGAPPAKTKKRRESPMKEEEAPVTKQEAAESKAAPAKRKKGSAVDDTAALRRSKRGRPA